MNSSPVVAVVGRPNVGKSTLVNRIIGRREAIVEERPGVTRDRNEFDVDWAGYDFTLVDTGGWLPKTREAKGLEDKVSEQAEYAIREADVTIFVIDARVRPTTEDALIAEMLRTREKPTFLVANKVDDASHELGMWEYLSMGLGDPNPVSALHGRGTADLLDLVVEKLPEIQEVSQDDEEDGEADVMVAIAIVGRPNVGKSTLFNSLIGEDRAVVHDEAGTTRDAIDTIVESDIGNIKFVDTAGMRRKAKISEDTEFYSLVRALKAIDKADVALLVIDSTVGVTHQDQRLSERIDAAGCPVVVVFNKWELVDADEREVLVEQVERKLGFLGDPPIMKTSALSGKGVHRLYPILAETITNYHRRVPTREVNLVVRRAQSAHPAPGGARVMYATQGAAEPPTFTLFVNRKIPRTYVRYIENQLREQLDLGSVPIKIRVRNRND
ncbi:MAG: ribosome biogenesis GTPase Der [Acidimicrobiaceae bacterium]|nr:ribosome biogenesis GTPase Der [Acidimicrobiaceae bacterium]MEC7844752.1 ribosome biogenesis GTPase Der [Actinomycetota bacterium]